MTALTTPEQIAMYRLATLRSALRLEIAGLSRRGQTAYSILKQEFGYKGNRERVLAQVCADLEAVR